MKRVIVSGIAGLIVGVVITMAVMIYTAQIKVSEDTGHIVWFGQDFKYDYQFTDDSPK